MNTKVIIILIALIGISVAWYLVSPIFNVVEQQDISPIVKDSMDSMSAEQKQEFEDAVNAMKDKTIIAEETMPVEATVLSQGAFHERAHEVQGKALLIGAGEKNILRFENFETINGPNLHIYLATDLGTEDFVDLGPIKGTKGDINYEIPKGTDLDKYNKVLVWCVPFRVLFSYAELK